MDRDGMFYGGAKCPRIDEPGHSAQGRVTVGGKLQQLVYLALAH